MMRRDIGATLRRLKPFEDMKEDILKLRGEAYRQIFYKVRRIINHQFTKSVRDGIKGFLFWGSVGVGKTAMAKALANDLMCPLLFVDSSDIARARYGESEQVITELFRAAGNQRCLILIDDAESVFPRLHELDRLDTSKIMVILTTNEISLMDRALRDRLYEIEFPLPTQETLIQAAKDLCEKYMIPCEPVLERIKANEDMKSVRDVEKLVMDYYAEGAV